MTLKRYARVVLVVGFSACAAALPAIGWDELLAEQLAESVPYRQAVLARRQAELRVAQLDLSYLPYLNVGTAGQSSISYAGGEDGGLQPFTLQPSLSFSNVFGANVALGLPVTFHPSAPEGVDPMSAGNPTLTVSRRIFEETESARLGSHAALIRARDAEARAFADARIGLVSQVFEARAALITVEHARRRLAVAQRNREASRDATTERELERAILQSERAVIQSERSLRTIDARVVQHVDSIHAEILVRFDGWIAGLPDPGTIPAATAAIVAQRLTVTAADARRSLSFLPYVPNPALSASLTYDRDDSDLEWRVGMSFTIPILDRGERAFASMERTESAEIERLRLGSARDNLDRTIRTAWEELELIEIELRLNELDLEAQTETTERFRRLNAQGFASDQALETAEIELSAAELRLERARNSFRIQQLQVLRNYE